MGCCVRSAADDVMLYQAYLAHSDILLPLRSLASVAMRTIGSRWPA
jgi:hypothetical protein